MRSKSLAAAPAFTTLISELSHISKRNFPDLHACPDNRIGLFSVRTASQLNAVLSEAYAHRQQFSKIYCW